jgi:hypothetical protein
MSTTFTVSGDFEPSNVVSMVMVVNIVIHAYHSSGGGRFMRSPQKEYLKGLLCIM